jgi:2-keto-3-deoxy-L-arabinonate dehydratase
MTHPSHFHPAWSGDVHGIVPVLPTPFDPHEDIDCEALAHLVDFAAESRVTAACLPAYGSEFYKLSETERVLVVETAVRAARGRLKIVAQSNHPSSKVASDLAKQNEQAGAGVISFALPRQFALAEDDLLRHAERIARAVSVPVLVQDFNPGGASVGAAFARRLNEVAPNVRFLNLEEPSMGPKVRSIRDATGGRVSVFEGWGGMYLLELMPTGICGAMPGLGMVDLFQRLVGYAHAGKLEEASAIFERMLPFIVYSLQSMEVFHHCEKQLLVRRGVLPLATVRDAALTLDENSRAYLDYIIARVLEIATGPQ